LVAAVTRSAQNLLLVLLGAAMLWITMATDEYLNYVRPSFRPVLVAAALVMIALGGAGLHREWRDTSAGGHPGPRTAWLLCLPACVIFLVAPPALGSFTAARDTGHVGQTLPPPTGGYPALHATGGPTEMTMSEFINRAAVARSHPATLRNYRVTLTGFAARRAKGDWYLTRFRLICCAADASPLRIVVRGQPQPPEGSWVEVTGTWNPPPPGQRRTDLDELRAQAVRRIQAPEVAYEP
jgi:uncharacterized repeat protein (TIGR03943 family)